MSTEVSYWKDFFERCGIPRKVCVSYAKTFSDNRLQPSMLPDLNKDLLKELGINAVGDVIAILKQAKAEADEEQERETLERLEKTTAAKQKEKPKIKKADPSKLTVTIKGQASTSSPKAAESARPALKRPALDKKKEAVPLKKISTTTNEPSLKVKMPEGNTARSRLLLEKAQQASQQPIGEKSTTVFQRLGALAGPEKTTIVRNMVSPGSKKAVTFASGVFKRQSPEVTSTTGESTEFGGMESDKSNNKQSALSRLGTGIGKPELKRELPLKSGRSDTAVRENFTVVLSNKSADGVRARLGPSKSITRTISNSVNVGLEELIVSKRIDSPAVSVKRSLSGSGLKERLGTAERAPATSSSGVFSRLG